MNITFKTNVRTVIRYNGREYSSVDQLPPEVRSKYETAIGKGLAATPGAKQNILVNGEQFASVNEMPAPDRKLYEDAMALVQDRGCVSSSDASVIPAWNRSLTSAQFRLVLLVAAFVAGAVFIRSLF